MAFFTVLGLFALWGIVAWVAILLALLIADAIWTHSLATTYVNVTGIILQQVWNFFQFFLNLMQRVVAMAPRGLQILLFMLLGVLGIGLIMNWFVAANVVCVGGTAYEGSNLPLTWMAKSLDSNPVSANTLPQLPNNDLSSEGISVNSSDGTSTFVSVPSSNYQSNVSFLFQLNVSREAFFNNVMNSDNSSFVAVDNAGQTVTFGCDTNNDVDVGLFGVQGLFSVKTMVLLIVVGAALWVFFKIV